MKELAFLNGKYMPISKAKISATDISVLRGYAIFDSVAALGKRVPFLPLHLKRFRRSAEILSLKVPYTDKGISKIIQRLLSLLKKSEREHTRIRLVLTGGDLFDSLSFDPQKSNFFVLAQSAPKHSPALYAKGAKLVTLEHIREYPEAKTNNYIAAVRMQPWKQKQGAYEILYTAKGKALECTTSNFFIVKGKKIITPKNNILKGITRARVIAFAKKSYSVQERDILVEELQSADEAFITATYKGLLPVTSINNFKIGKGIVGPISKHLMAQIEEQLRKS